MSRCKIRGCKGSNEPLLPCAVPKCTEKVHKLCCGRFKTFSHLTNFDWVICGKRCHNAMVKDSKTNKKRPHWHNDGTEKSGNKSSITLLLDWLTTEPNYKRWKRGGRNNNNGVRKDGIYEEVSRFIKDGGIEVEQSPDDVKRKLAGLAKSYKDASDWLTNTGQGVENERDIRQAILSICIHWDELHPIMGESDVISSLFTDKDLDKEDTDDNTDSNSNSSEEEEQQSSVIETTQQPEHPTTISTNDNNVDITKEITATASPASTISLPSSIERKRKNPPNPINRAPVNKSKLNYSSLVARAGKKKEEFADKMSSFTTTRLVQIDRENELKSEELKNSKMVSAVEVEKLKAEAEVSRIESQRLKKQLETEERDNFFKLLTQRKALEREGYSKDEIDMYLPLPVPKQQSDKFIG